MNFQQITHSDDIAINLPYVESCTPFTRRSAYYGHQMTAMQTQTRPLDLIDRRMTVLCAII